MLFSTKYYIFLGLNANVIFLHYFSICVIVQVLLINQEMWPEKYVQYQENIENDIYKQPQCNELMKAFTHIF